MKDWTLPGNQREIKTMDDKKIANVEFLTGLRGMACLLVVYSHRSEGYAGNAISQNLSS
jgi:peptidoglycan/LPS O-acetylase OafA/YrhL